MQLFKWTGLAALVLTGVAIAVGASRPGSTQLQTGEVGLVVPVEIFEVGESPSVKHVEVLP